MKRAVGALVLIFACPASSPDAAQSCAQTMQQIKDAAHEVWEDAHKSNKDGIAYAIVKPIIDIAAKADDQKIAEFCARPDNALLLRYVQPHLDKARDEVRRGVILAP